MKVKCPKNKIFELDSINKLMTCPNTCDRPEQCKRIYFEPQIIENIVLEQKENQTVEIKNENINQNGLRNRLRPNRTIEQNNEEIEKLINSNDVIIHIGINEYFAKNVDSALIEIFRHWNTGAVFQNQQSFTSEFTNLLKIKYRNNYQEIINDVLNNNKNINSKFYQLFYKHIYAGKTICQKFYFANGYQQHEITPICHNQNEIFEEINRKHYYLSEIAYCQEELLEFLHLELDNLLRLAVLYLSNNYHKIGYFKSTFNENGNSFYDFIVIDTTSLNFINNLNKVDKYLNMQNKLEFLKQYQINKNGQIIKREEKFIPKRIIGEVDDCVYELLGITKYNTTQCKDVLELYLNLLNEFIIINEPKELNLPNLKLSINNFYSEIENIVHSAYSKCTDISNENNKIDEDIQRFYLVLVLKNNHLLDYFINHCLTDKINQLLDLIKPNINYRDYYNSLLEPIYTFFDGKRHTISEYFQKKINENDIEQIVEIICNDAVFKLIENNVKETDLQYIETRIQDLAKEV